MSVIFNIISNQLSGTTEFLNEEKNNNISNGTIAFNTDLGVPIYFKNDNWYTMCGNDICDNEGGNGDENGGDTINKVLLFRQTVVEGDETDWLFEVLPRLGYLDSVSITENNSKITENNSITGNNLNLNEPYKFSILNDIDKYKNDGKWHFEYKHFNDNYSDDADYVVEWTQTKSIFEQIDSGDDGGFIQLNVNFTNTTDSHSPSALTIMDEYDNIAAGSYFKTAINPLGDWWNAIATKKPHNGGIPGLNSMIAKKVELWVYVQNDHNDLTINGSTILTFALGQDENTDLVSFNNTYGSNLNNLSTGDGFITADSGTPNIKLEWWSNVVNVLQLHGGVWKQNEIPINNVLQLDLDDTFHGESNPRPESEYPEKPVVTFIPSASYAVKIIGFNLVISGRYGNKEDNNSDDVADFPDEIDNPHSWIINIYEFIGSDPGEGEALTNSVYRNKVKSYKTAKMGGNDNTWVDINFLGEKGKQYILEFDINFIAPHWKGAIYNFKFAEFS